VQLTNYLKGITTNERFSRSNNRSNSDEEPMLSIGSEEDQFKIRTVSTKSDYTNEVRRPS
jgi:hypothetical protein